MRFLKIIWILGYLTKAESGLRADLSKEQHTLNEIIQNFKVTLKQNQYNGHYFDRKTKKKDKICDEFGIFNCEGRYDKNLCNYTNLDHSINPYDSAESRIMFSTWNLDHV